MKLFDTVVDEVFGEFRTIPPIAPENDEFKFDKLLIWFPVTDVKDEVIELKIPIVEKEVLGAVVFELLLAQLKYEMLLLVSE